MKAITKHENAMKNIMALQHHASDASHYVKGLEDKIKYQSLEKKLSKIFRDLLVLKFDIEDLDKINVEKCDKCFNIL